MTDTLLPEMILVSLHSSKMILHFVVNFTHTNILYLPQLEHFASEIGILFDLKFYQNTKKY